MENILNCSKHIFIYDDDEEKDNNLSHLKKHFCGVVKNYSQLNQEDYHSEKIIYLSGNISALYKIIKDMPYKKLLVIRGVSYNYDNIPCEIIPLGKVPINIHNVGIYFRQFFDDKDYFEAFNAEHKCQSLTESNKPGAAFRKGIYLSDIKEIEKDKLQFHLLRCSSNLDGPTDKFQAIDYDIIKPVENACSDYFIKGPGLNHVLAQVYHNTNKKKAKISPHADKTKDMTSYGVIAFCTFYQKDKNMIQTKPSQNDPFDLELKNTSVLTKMRFRLKKTVKDENLVKEFSIPLYPNSVFIIPLSTNRFYTHEIKPSALPADQVPTRLGYVIRCSKTQALYENHQTYIKDDDGKYVPMKAITEENKKKLQDLYYEENVTDNKIDYGFIDFSMNDGDYKKPMRWETML